MTYIRCHDDIGWAIDNADAVAVGVSGYFHQMFLSDYYSGIHPGSPARGLVFQANPQTGDRRISGVGGEPGRPGCGRLPRNRWTWWSAGCSWRTR